MMGFRGTRNQIRKTFAATLFSIKYLVEHFARMSIPRSLLTVSSYYLSRYSLITDDNRSNNPCTDNRAMHNRLNTETSRPKPNNSVIHARNTYNA